MDQLFPFLLLARRRGKERKEGRKGREGVLWDVEGSEGIARW